MKKTVFLLALCSVIASMTTSVMAAGEAAARATASEATIKPVIDGQIDAVWNDVEKMYGGIYGDTVDGAENLMIVSSYGSLMWDDEGLYLLGVMYDKTIPESDEGGRNSIDFWVSETYTLDTAYSAPGDWHICKASTGEEVYYTGNEAVYDKSVGQKAVAVYDEYFVVELFIPWQTEGFNPEVGTEIGYTISFNDDTDVDGEREICSLWAVNSADSIAFYAETLALPRVKFVEGPAVEAEPEATPDAPAEDVPAEAPVEDAPVETAPVTADAGIVAAAAVMAAAAGIVLSKKR